MSNNNELSNNQAENGKGLGNIDIKSLALPQDFQNMPGAKKLWTTIPVRKPGKTEFFRVLDDENYTITTAVIELKEEGEPHPVYLEMSGSRIKTYSWR